MQIGRRYSDNLYMNYNDFKFNSIDQFKNKKYTGRGIFQGISSDNNIIQIYWISGRSQESRERNFIFNDDTVKVVSNNKYKNNNSDLYYTSMISSGLNFIVSNGAQTDYVLQALKEDINYNKLSVAIKNAPPSTINTARITGIISIKNKTYFYLSILKPVKGNLSIVYDSWLYKNIPTSWGFGVSTYNGFNNEPDPYEGEPFSFPINETGDNLLKSFWSYLNLETRICISLRSIDLKKHIWDLYTYNPNLTESINHTQGKFYV